MKVQLQYHGGTSLAISDVGTLSIDGRKKAFNGMERNCFRENNRFAEGVNESFHPDIFGVCINLNIQL